MPRFFFDTRALDRSFPDREGVEFAGSKAAHEAAARRLGELVRDVVKRMQEGVLTVTVRDEAGRPTFRASLTVDLEDMSRDG